MSSQISQQQQTHNKIISTCEINEIKTEGVQKNNINSQEEHQINNIIEVDTTYEANNNNITSSSTNNSMLPTNSQKIVKVKNKNKNKAQLDVNFNIKYDNNGEEETTHLKYISLKKKQKVNIEYQDIDFLSQSQFRFVLYPLSSSSINNSPQFDYQDLCWVKYYAFETYNCPICLSSELQVPVITRCSHIFCWVCLVTYNNYHALYLQEKKKSRLADCPLCKDKLDLKNDGVMFCDIIKSNHYSMERKDEEANKDNSKISNCNDSFKDKDINEDINEYNDIKRVNKTNSTNNTTNPKNLNTYTTGSYPKRSSFNSNNKNNINNNNNDQSSNFKSRRSTYNSNNSNQNNNKKKYSNNSNRNINTTNNINFISFNLSFRTNFMIYNVHRDKNLSKFYKYNSNTIIPDVNLNQASFSMIFKIEIPELQAMYESKNLELEKLLNQELDDTSKEKDGNDDKRVKACFECISILKTMIDDLKISNNSKNESSVKTNPNVDANTVKKEVDAMRFKYFYQENNGDIYYLNPIDYLILITEYKSIDYLPTKIEGSILEIEKYIMTPYLKNKWNFLSHLKLGAQFYLVELDLSSYISNSTMKQFESILSQRKYNREQIKLEEDYYHSVVEEEAKLNHMKTINDYSYYLNKISSFEDKEISNNKKIEDCINNKENNNNEAPEERKESNDNENTNNSINIIKAKKQRLEFLLEGGTLDQLKAKETEKEKELSKYLLFNDNDEFPELNTIDEEGCNKNQNQYKIKGGGKKKKKKFVDLDIKL